MTVRKIHIELSLSKNYDKVTIGMTDEPIEAETDEELKAGIRQRFKLIREEIKKEFEEIQ